MMNGDLSPAMRKALINEWWAWPKFTVLLNQNKNTIRALERRGLVKGLTLTPNGMRAAKELCQEGGQGGKR